MLFSDLQEADVVRHVGQSVHLLTPPVKLCHLLLQSVDVALSPAAPGGRVGREELIHLGSHQVQALPQLQDHTGTLPLQSLDRGL